MQTSADNTDILSEDQEQQQFGQRLRAAREQHGLSQEAVADRIGVPRSAVSSIETGKRKMSSSELKQFAQLYKLSTDMLLGVALMPQTTTRLTRQLREQGKQRGSVRKGDTVSPMLFANGSDLKEWANRRVAQSEFPRIVRQLIYATVPHVRRISFAADEGVQLGGWDGMVETTEGNAFVPDGLSVWELGTNADIKRKADSDYAKRTADPGEIDPESATFVFVTPRRWGGKEVWLAEKRKNGMWRDVRAYDGDDLAAWLELAPGVHVRVSLLIGTGITGAEDLTHWWSAWSSVTRSPITAKLIIAGRDGEADRVQQWLKGPPALRSIQGENRDEAIAFLAAALDPMGAGEDTANLTHCVVVETATAWQWLATSESPLVLIPTFEDRSLVAAAIAAGHYVLVPLGNGDTSSGETIELPRPRRDAIRDALLKMDAQETEIDSLATLGRRSLAALRRKLAMDAAILRPRWGQASEGRALLPALLAGRWDETNANDREILARLAGVDYPSIAAAITRWANESDPPVRRVGNIWMLASREDAWPLLSRYLNRDDLQRFTAVVAEVLGQHDPRYDLPLRERQMAGILGKLPPHSGHMREGFAETLGMMATHSDTCKLGDADSGQAWADRIVGHLFAEGADWRVWASLAWLLPLLAEASPRVFLYAVERGLVGDPPVLVNMFTDHQRDFSMFDASPHTGLLWALELLAWSPEYLSEAAGYLAILARIDPGGEQGKFGNRPLRSLREIFLSWHPQTTASITQRLGVLDYLRRREPETAWELMIRVLPEMHDIGEHTSTPRWRDWASGVGDETTWADVHRMVKEITTRLLDDAGTDGHRWSDLIKHAADLPQGEFEAIAHRLTNLDSSTFPSAGTGTSYGMACVRRSRGTPPTPMRSGR